MTIPTYRMPAKNRIRSVVIFSGLLLALSLGSDAQHRTTVTTAVATSAVEVKTEPNAAIWIDELRRGTTDASGRLSINQLKPGRHTLRVRATGFTEKTLPLTAGSRVITVPLVRTTDAAELAFQTAESAREKARDDESRKAAVELYRKAIKLRKSNAAAHLGLARVLLDQDDYDAASAQVEEARRYRPLYAEASAVQGRIQRSTAFMDQAIVSFKRSIREARGFQPEAHTGLAMVYEEKGRYDEAAAEFQTALQQLSDSEPVIYQLLGAVYEKLEKYNEAVASYEKYLELAPNGSLAPALRSVIEQLRIQASGQQLSP
jgi:Flp pilus assembly protein TadD